MKEIIDNGTSKCCTIKELNKPWWIPKFKMLLLDKAIILSIIAGKLEQVCSVLKLRESIGIILLLFGTKYVLEMAENCTNTSIKVSSTKANILNNFILNFILFLPVLINSAYN